MLSTYVCTSFGRRSLAPLVQGGGRAFAAIQYPAPREGMDWASHGFSLATKDTKMITATCKQGRMWSPLKVEQYGPLSLEPAATVLNYGQGIFEGIKAYRTNQGRIVIFRPSKNGQRLAAGARRLLMSPLPMPMFLEACGLAVKENADLVPPAGEGALYLRPILFGSGAQLGLKPSSMYQFVIYVSPTSEYFGAAGASSGVRMMLCKEHQRAAPMGIGHVKAIGNYAQCFDQQHKARADGYSDTIYLDASGEYIEEAAGANFFCLGADGVLHTPSLGTILPGVTRDSVIHLANQLQDLGVKMHVGQVHRSVVLNAKEAFLCGTGAGITPIAHIASDEESNDMAAPGPVTKRLSQALTDIHHENVEDVMNWLHDPFVAPASRDSFVEPTF